MTTLLVFLWNTPLIQHTIVGLCEYQSAGMITRTKNKKDISLGLTRGCHFQACELNQHYWRYGCCSKYFVAVFPLMALMNWSVLFGSDQGSPGEKSCAVARSLFGEAWKRCVKWSVGVSVWRSVNIHSNKSLILTQKRSNQVGRLDIAEGSLLVGALFTSEIRFGLLFTTDQISRD